MDRLLARHPCCQTSLSQSGIVAVGSVLALAGIVAVTVLLGWSLEWEG